MDFILNNIHFFRGFYTTPQDARQFKLAQVIIGMRNLNRRITYILWTVLEVISA